MHNISQNIRILLLLSLCSASLIACQQPQSSGNSEAVLQYDFHKNTGWIHGNCIAIKNNSLKQGTQVDITVLGKEQRRISAEIVKETDDITGCFGLYEDRAAINKSENRRFYTLNIQDADTNFIAIGLINTNNRLTHKDLETKVFGSCETSEGMNFYIWKEKEFKDKPLWTDYYYLGYDVTPTCPENN